MSSSISHYRYASPLVYKSSAMVPSKIHHHHTSAFHSQSFSRRPCCHPTYLHTFIIKMLFNSFVASALVLALTSSVNAQASTPNSPKTQSGTVFFPPGSASPGTSGIQTISASAPCGGNMSLPIDPSSFSPITVGSNKQFTIQAENFGR